MALEDLQNGRYRTLRLIGSGSMGCEPGKHKLFPAL